MLTGLLPYLSLGRADRLRAERASGWGFAVGGWVEEAKGRADRPGREVPGHINRVRPH